MRQLKLQFPKLLVLSSLVFFACFGFSCNADLVLPSHFCGKEFWKDKTTLIFFGYAGCQTVCPRMLQKANQIQELYKKQSLRKNKDIQFLMISVAEKTKNLELVQESYSNQFPNLRFLQCSSEETKRLAGLLKAPYYKNLGFLNGKEPYEHSELMFLIDENGKVRARFHFIQKPEEILRMIDFE